jgi:hypothetical protein
MTYDTEELQNAAERGEIGDSASKLDIVIPQRPNDATASGTEIAAFIATGPLFVILTLHICDALYSTFPSSHPLVVLSAAYFWYIFVISVEIALKLSPTLQYIIAASRTESIGQIMQRIQESSTVRLEVHMTSLRALAPFVGTGPDETVPCEVAWTGKSVFPVGSTHDATLVPDEMLASRAAWICFGTELQFIDERSRHDFQRHVEKFISANKHRGDAYELTQHLIVPGVPVEYQSMSFGNVHKRPPIRSSVSGFFVFTLFGLTLPFRFSTKYTLPRHKVIVVKQVSSVQRTSAIDSQGYPTIDFGA